MRELPNKEHKVTRTPAQLEKYPQRNNPQPPAMSIIQACMREERLPLVRAWAMP